MTPDGALNNVQQAVKHARNTLSEGAYREFLRKLVVAGETWRVELQREESKEVAKNLETQPVNDLPDPLDMEDVDATSVEPEDFDFFDEPD